MTDPLALTSRWMAAARAYESGRPDRLFDDPLATALADPEVFAWLGRMEPVTRLGGPQLGPGLYCVVRTRFFDDFLLRASPSFGIRQIVLLAAGMDARAFRLRWPPGTHIFELDFPEVISIKEAIIGEAELRAGRDRHSLAVDLRQPSWPEALREASYEARELSAWVLEGFLFYVTQATVQMLLERVRALASLHS